MPFRLDAHVIAGEVHNLWPNRVQGYLILRGIAEPLCFELVGNAAADLEGQHLRFVAADADQRREVHTVTPRLALRQIGVLTAATANEQVRHVEDPEREARRSAMGEPSPPVWKRALRLTWSGQNGDVSICLVEPQLHMLPPELDEDAEEGALPLLPPSPRGAPPGPLADTTGGRHHPGHGPDARMLLDLDTDANGTDWEDSDGTEDDDDEKATEWEEIDEVWSGEPITADLQTFLATYLEPEIAAEPIARSRERLERTVHEMELMDFLIENEEGIPMGEFLARRMTIRAATRLDEVHSLAELRRVLAELALFGIAYDVCPHVSWKEAYRILLAHVLKEEHCYPQLRHTDWIQHFGTSDHCPECESEIDDDDEGDGDEDDEEDEDEDDEERIWGEGGGPFS